jgi:hypothetical protein
MPGVPAYLAERVIDILHDTTGASVKSLNMMKIRCVGLKGKQWITEMTIGGYFHRQGLGPIISDFHSLHPRRSKSSSRHHCPAAERAILGPRVHQHGLHVYSTQVSAIA